MTSLQNLPEEIVSLIFSEFTQRDLQQCQRVCRAWYSPAHVKFLNTVTLPSHLAIEKFNKAIDHNPQTSYLNAVKTIHIDFPYSSPTDYQLERNSIEQLFFRFPNLANVEIQIHAETFKLLSQFNDEICTSMLLACPKLDRFKVEITDREADENIEALFNVRLLITILDGAYVHWAVEQDMDYVDFVSKFPRLRSIIGENNIFDSFQGHLPVLEVLPSLTTIYLGSDDKEDLIAHLRTMEQNKQDRLIKRLAEITKFESYTYYAFSPPSIKFATKYLTGLNSFILDGQEFEDWTDEHTQVYCDHVLTLASSAKIDSRIRLPQLEFPMLSSCFPATVDQVYESNRPNRILNLVVWDNMDQRSILEVKQSKSERKIDVVAFMGHNRVLDDLFKQCTTINTDEFTMDFGYNYKLSLNIDTFDEFLNQMPSVRKVILDIPESFIDTKEAQNQDNVYPQVEQLLLRPQDNTKFQKLLHTRYFAFPNLKHLQLCYYSGIWHEEHGEYRIMLPQFSLQSLSIDVTPIARKIQVAFESIEVITMEQTMFVLEVKFLNSGRQSVYLVSAHALTVLNVDTREMKAYVQQTNFIRLKITINSLQQLRLCVYKKVLINKSNSSYLHDDKYNKGDTKHVTVF